jgi:hypothetical protein
VIDLDSTTDAAAELWIGLVIAQEAADELGGLPGLGTAEYGNRSYLGTCMAETYE